MKNHLTSAEEKKLPQESLPTEEKKLTQVEAASARGESASCGSVPSESLHSQDLPPVQKPVRSLVSGYLRLLLRILLIAGIGLLIFRKVFLITQASGSDMFPSIKDGDLAIAFRPQHKYAKNDVVVYTHGGKRSIGRIAAMGKDVVTLDESGILLVNGTAQNGEILYPTYAKGDLTYPYTIPEGSVFILGDYRSTARDSRELGAIPMERVEGKVITILRRRGL